MPTIQLDPELVATLAELQMDDSADLTQKINDTVNDAVRTLLDELSDQKLAQERQTFERLHPQLKQTYLGQFVAIHQGRLVDADPDQRTLYIRVHRRYPHTIIAIFPVRESSEMTVYNFTGFQTSAKAGSA